MKAIKALDGTIIPLHDIVDVGVFPEQCTGDGEFDTQNGWRVDVVTSRGITTVFEATEFDNPKKWFYILDAVEGKNFEAAKKRCQEIQQALSKESASTVELI